MIKYNNDNHKIIENMFIKSDVLSSFYIKLQKCLNHKLDFRVDVIPTNQTSVKTSCHKNKDR